MSKNTTIHWADSTVNPVMGCSGCELHNKARPDETCCYAAVLHTFRKTHSGFTPDFNIVKLFPSRTSDAAKWQDLSGTRRTDKSWLDGFPRIIFLSDMGDALSEGQIFDSTGYPVAGGVPFDYLKQEIVDVVMSDNGRRHIWPWLTKRARRMAEFSDWLKSEHGLSWPSNLWPGTTVTRASTLHRLDELVKVGDKTTTRITSVEPQLEDISLLKWLQSEQLHWVIVGGESRQKAPPREFKVEWARRLRDECFKTNVAMFMKQLGTNATLGGMKYATSTEHGAEWQEWPVDIRIRQVPVLPAMRHIRGTQGQVPVKVRQAKSDQMVSSTQSTPPQAWSPDLCKAWTKAAKPHVLTAIRLLAEANTAKTTHELNEAAGCNSGGAIVGGLNAWATKNGLPFPLVKHAKNGQPGYRFVSEQVQQMFFGVL